MRHTCTFQILKRTNWGPSATTNMHERVSRHTEATASATQTLTKSHTVSHFKTADKSAHRDNGKLAVEVETRESKGTLIRPTDQGKKRQPKNDDGDDDDSCKQLLPSFSMSIQHDIETGGGGGAESRRGKKHDRGRPRSIRSIAMARTTQHHLLWRYLLPEISIIRTLLHSRSSYMQTASIFHNRQLYLREQLGQPIDHVQIVTGLIAVGQSSTNTRQRAVLNIHLFRSFPATNNSFSFYIVIFGIMSIVSHNHFCHGPRGVSEIFGRDP